MTETDFLFDLNANIKAWEIYQKEVEKHIGKLKRFRNHLGVDPEDSLLKECREIQFSNVDLRAPSCVIVRTVENLDPTLNPTLNKFHSDMEEVNSDIVVELEKAGFDPCRAIDIANTATRKAWEVWMAEKIEELERDK